MAKIRNVRLAAMMLSCFLLTDIGRADPPSHDKSFGLRTVLPVVPLQPPRPAEGTIPSEAWRVDRSGAENKPLASFIDSLKGNDAALKVVVGQGRVLTTRRAIARKDGVAVIAVSDPTIVDFEIMPDPRMIRIRGKRAGVTDLLITTDDDEIYTFEIHVGFDLVLMRARLQQIFPDTLLNLGQIHEHLIVEGQARSPEQVSQILETLGAYLASLQVPQSISGQQGPGDQAAPYGPATRPQEDPPEEGDEEPGRVVGGDDRPSTESSFVTSRIINLLRVPGVHQVMLQVRIAELDRTAMRKIGADILKVDPSNGNLVGTQIGGATIEAAGAAAGAGLASLAGGAISASTTAFGIFPTGDFQILMRALRENAVLTVLAEPNLMAMSGHQASFLAGGEFPVPVPQSGAGAGGGVTVEFKEFGVQLVFVPYVMDDERIRLHVIPEVSTIDFSIGTTLVVGGDPVPGVNTRKAETTVEMREGQTLAIAGLLELDLSANTQRIPGLGDLPYIGPMFSNTSHKRVEKELLVIVTPHLVSPMNPDQVGPLPGENIKDPTDKELFLFNRIEGRTCREFRATNAWDRPWTRTQRMEMEQNYGNGPIGYSR